MKKEDVKILVVDTDFIWTEELRVAFEDDGFRNIKVGADGETALRIITEFEPDIVIVDQTLPHRDGLAVVQYIREEEMASEVILTTRHTSELLWFKATNLNIQYIVPKPTHEEVIVARVNDIVDLVIKQATHIDSEREPEILNEEDADDDVIMLVDEIGLESNIGRILMALGIQAHLKGYKYLKTAIVMTIINEHITSAMTRELYPQIARRFNTTASNVERDMRHAIETAWLNAPVKLKKAYFGLQYLKANPEKKPSNSLFINTIGEKLRHNLKGQIALMSI